MARFARRNMPTKENKKRISIAFFIIAILMVALLFRTAWIQVIDAEEYSNRAVSQQLSDIPIEAKRGSILDTNGKELATSVPVYSLWVWPSQIQADYTEKEIDDTCEKLAGILDKEASKIKESLTSGENYLKLAKDLDKATTDKIRELNLLNFEIVENSRRFYPLGSQASQLLGSVNDDNEGRSGIEAEFDIYLSGIAGRQLVETDRNGNILSYGSKKYYQAQDGYNVTLTIDEVLQHYAEKAIATAKKKTKADKVMCLVMDPKTSDILAMAVNPSYDANSPLSPLEKDEKKYDKMDNEEKGKYLSTMWRNPIVSDLYEPGSTFKLITTSAALEEGVATPESEFDDPGYIDVDGVVLHCWHTAGHGHQTLLQAVGNSCNPVQVKLVQRMGTEKYYDYLEMFGITDITHVDLPAETSAIIKDEENLGNVDFATMAFGQGIAVTPLQLATAVCAIGNGGLLQKPRIVKQITDNDGNVIKEYQTEKVRKVISSKTASEMRKIMEYVVSDGGATLAQVDGYRVGGKTGTANKAVAGGYSSDTFSSFIGMAPMNDPRLVVLVVVDNPKGEHYGSIVAAPAAQDFLEDALPYLEIAPTEDSGKDKDSDEVYVPDMTGLSYDEASRIIRSLGLSVKAMPEEGGTDFVVADQFPKPGKAAEKNSTVYLYRD